jgi:hypothetical protein
MDSLSGGDDFRASDQNVSIEKVKGAFVTKEKFLSEYRRLVEEHRERGANVGCVECQECRACIDCVFCRDCNGCYRSRYSVECSESLLLTHCERCRNCRSLAYCQDCDHCGDSNYLVSCRDCFECDYCFGCVGLARTDFHILNRKYSRADYFREVAALREALGLPAPSA